MDATDVRDDPRFLTRVGFGIKSPRVTKLRLDKTRVFRSLAHHDFEVCMPISRLICYAHTPKGS